MYSALDVARYIINYSNKKYYEISNLKLQKLLYFVQAYFLAFTDSKEGCFSDRIEAWAFGPVVPTVYHEFKHFGNSNIPPVESYLVFEKNNFWSGRSVPFDESDILEKDRKIISGVVDKFKDFSATELVSLSHNQKPWKAAYIPSENNEISNESIRRYFSN